MKKKNPLNIVRSVIVWIVVLFAVGMMIFTVISVNTFDQNHRNIFGYKFFVVRTDSMAATDFDAGDIVIIKETDPSTLQVGDIIAFISQDPESYGEAVTHKIRRLTTTESGQRGFITYGTTSDTDDRIIVTYPYILGKYTRRIPDIGSFFIFLRSTPGYICCILIPFMLLILNQGLKTLRLFRRYKGEQMEEMQEERRKLQEERDQAAEMMKELQALRAQLGMTAPAAEPPADSPAEVPAQE